MYCKVRSTHVSSYLVKQERQYRVHTLKKFFFAVDTLTEKNIGAHLCSYRYPAKHKILFNKTTVMYGTVCNM